MPQTFNEWFSRNCHIGDFQSLPLDVQKRIKARFERSAKKCKIQKSTVRPSIYGNPKDHDKILISIISEKGPIKSGDLYLEYVRMRLGKYIYLGRNFRCRLKKISDAGLITVTGYGRAREYDKKEKTGDK